MFTPIPDFPSYGINRSGEVKRLDKGNILTPVRTGDGYHCFTLSESGRKKFVHRHFLVASTFHGPRPFNKAEVRHLDGNPENDNADNLAWGSHKENGEDMVRHGRSVDRKGEKHHMAKLTEADIIKIRNDDRPQRLIAADFGIDRSQISRIKNFKRW